MDEVRNNNIESELSTTIMKAINNTKIVNSKED